MRINVTQPALPPLDEFNESLKKIWDNKWLTNGGPFHEEFEKELADYLGVKYLSLFSNGTIALITALNALRISGEVITTPYSFVATTHSLWWNNIKPVFVDIGRDDFNLNPAALESAITTRTTAIMPVHVYGNPCNHEAIQEIADRYGLKVIYDAAHAFGVKLGGESILNFGDLSVLSFHATKVFNTIEGGAIICHDAKTKKRIDQLKNFGFVDEVTVEAHGINGKMNELQSAYGLLQLKYIGEHIVHRKSLSELYDKALSNVDGIEVMRVGENVSPNYGYYPILVHEDYGLGRDELYDLMKEQDIYARRYFYPLISQFPQYRNLESSNTSNLKVAKEVSEKVICLPIHPGIGVEDVEKIVDFIQSNKR